MKVLIIISHHRKTSITHKAKNALEKGLLESGHDVDILDIFDLNFNPVLTEADEPDWHNHEQNFSQEVLDEQQRLSRYDALAFVFPVYWFSLPALLKGYIDRVFNKGFLYGDEKSFNLKKIFWLALAASSEERFDTCGFTKSISHTLNEGVAGYCRVEKSKTAFLYSLMEDSHEVIERNINAAYEEGLQFDEW